MLVDLVTETKNNVSHRAKVIGEGGGRFLKFIIYLFLLFIFYFFFKGSVEVGFNGDLCLHKFLDFD